jgi:hypothetical protein
MSTSWLDTAIDKLSTDTMAETRRLVQKWAFLMSADNVNIRSTVFLQCLANCNHFESGTAATVYPIIDTPPLKGEDFHARAKTHDVITYKDFCDPLSARRILEQKRYHILQFLLESPYFSHYKKCGDKLLAPPPPIHALPTGPEHKSVIRPLETMKIDQASYKGNEEWINDIVDQLDLGGKAGKRRLAHHTVIPSVGDELTNSCIQGLKRFKGGDDNGFDRLDFLVGVIGWFHTLMCLAILIWQHHSGELHRTGLVRDVTLLQHLHIKRRKESAKTATPSAARAKETPVPKVATAKRASGPTFHNLDKLIMHALKAHILVCWLHISGKKELSELVDWDPEPSSLVDMAKKILKDFGSNVPLTILDFSNNEIEDEGTEGWSEGASSSREESAPLPAPVPLTTIPKEKTTQATMFDNSVQFLQDALVYIQLKWAIKQGDVGRLQDLLPTLGLMFKGGRHSKYAQQVFETMQHMKNEWPPELA